MPFIYRKLTKDDALSYWDLRLSALKECPNAFLSSYEESMERKPEEVKDSIIVSHDHYILAAFDNQNVIGMVGFNREKRMKIKHKAWIWGVYVYPKYRGQGIAKRLMEEVIQNARQMEGLKQIKLDVAAKNKSAKGLYIRLGFETYGIEKNALYVDGKYNDEEFMVKFL